jgi:DNA (cytosine-5)-methyltransferase 1
MTAFQNNHKLSPIAHHLVNPTPGYRWAGGLIVDNFCGGGGASTGMWQALGVSPDMAVNHNAKALAMHKKNHPETRHYNDSVWQIDVRAATGGRPVLFGWFSPDCTHFSGARGGTPVKKDIRGLAWIVKKWAGQSDMAIFALENVKEFQTWGPLIAKRCPKTKRVIKLVATGKKDKKGNPSFKEVASDPGEQVPYREQAMVPDKKRAGRTYRKFIRQLGEMGYEIGANKQAVAYDYGDGTIRKRLVMIGRKDGLPVDVEPKATHGDPRKPGFAESGLLPWVTAGDKLDFSLPCPSIFLPGRDLAEKTMERIFKGVKKFVEDAGDDAFLVKVNHGYDQFRGQGLTEPLQTVTGKLGTGLVQAQLVTCIDHRSTKDPSQSLNQPLSSVTSKARHVTVGALLKHFTGVVGVDLHQPLPTITAVDHNSVMQADLVEAAHIQRDFGNSVGHAADEPLGAITAGGGGKSALVTSHLLKMKGTCKDGQPTDTPIGTIQAQGNHYAEVWAFLTKFYATGAIGQTLNEPIHTIRAGDTFGLVTIKGVDYEIVDIGMRMLEPHELYACQGFPADYEHKHVGLDKPLSKAEQVRMVGNSVPPGMAAAFVRANVPLWALSRFDESAA